MPDNNETNPLEAAADPDMGLLPETGIGDLEGELEKVLSDGLKEHELGTPEGTFRVVIVKAAVGRSNSSGRLQIHYELEVASGHEAEGQKLNKYDGLSSAKQASMAYGQLSSLGVNPKTINAKTLPGILLSLQGRMIEVMGKQNPPFYNIYFQKMVDSEADGIPASSGDHATPPF